MPIILNASQYSKTFWFEAAKLPENQKSHYHVYEAYHYKDKIDVSRLKNALQAMVNTHGTKVSSIIIYHFQMINDDT